MHPIKKYYDDLAQSLAHRSSMGSTSGHSGDTGSNREELIQDFINKHTPDRQRCFLGGKIIGLNRQISKQIDCISCSDLAPIFNENTRSIHIVESVSVAISVKSYLDKTQLFDSLDNLASIPQLSEIVVDQTSSIKYNGLNF